MRMIDLKETQRGLYENKKPRFRNRGFCCGPIRTSGSTKSSYFSIGDTSIHFFKKSLINWFSNRDLCRFQTNGKEFCKITKKMF